MSESEIADVVSLWQKEYKELDAHADINHVQIFENKGDVMGCSNPHPHGQIWAQRTVPQETEKKSLCMKDHWGRCGRSILEDYVAQELKLDERIILENEHFVAIVPYWAVWPYETMIVPKRRISNIMGLSEGENWRSRRLLKQQQYDWIIFSKPLFRIPREYTRRPQMAKNTLNGTFTCLLSAVVTFGHGQEIYGRL